MASREQIQATLRRKRAKIALCRKCKQEKPWSEFQKSPSRRPFGLSSCCIPCDNARKAEQKRKNYWSDLEAGRRQSRAANLKRNFGITIEEYETQFAKQKGLCGCCGEAETYIHHATNRTANLAVDHCHRTGRIRKLLCSNCNKGLGCFKDDPDRLQKAINYLKNS